MMRLTPKFATLAVVLGLSNPGLAQSNGPSFEGYTRIDFSLPAEVERLLIVDADRDGLADILSVAKEEISLYFQRSTGDFDFSTPDTSIILTGRSVGWELSENYPDANGVNRFSLLALVDGTKVQQWRIEDRQFSAPVDLLDNLSGFAGSGVNRLHFSRDINDDGRDDLIIPGAGTLQLFIREADGGYQQAISVLSDMRITSNLFVRQNIERDVGQTLTIPLIELRDVNNDKRPDLISETEERFDVSLANASGDYFPQSPTFSIDREEIRERLGNFDVDQLDFSNLTGILALTHEEILEDVDGDNIDDFVLREGGKVSLFTGNAKGMDFTQPKQVLRSGGNVLKVFLHDEDGDGRKDLWLWRIEPISVGDLFLWLAISGSVNVEAFVYRNEGESFARRPARQVTVALKFPSAVRMISSVVDIREQARAVENTSIIPTAVANISGVGNAQDLVVLLDEQVQIFHNSIAPTPPLAEDRFLASLNYSRTRNDYEIDVRRIIDEFEIAQNKDLRTVQGRAPDQSFALQQAMRNGDLISAKLNADERDDLFVFLERGKEHITGIVLLSTD